MNTKTTKRTTGRLRLAFFGLALTVLFPRGLAAQDTPDETAGLDDDGRAVVSILPIVGEDETVNAAVSLAVRSLQKYSPRMISA